MESVAPARARGELGGVPALVLLTVAAGQMVATAEFFRRYGRASGFLFEAIGTEEIPMEAAQKTSFRQILNEEYAQAQNSWTKSRTKLPIPETAIATATRCLWRTDSAARSGSARRAANG